MKKQVKQSFLYGSTILMFSMVIVKVIGAVFKIPLTNILGESGMGYFTSAYTLYTAVYALSVAGLSAAVARMVAEYSAKKRYRDVRKLFHLSVWLFFFMGVLGFLIIVFAAKSFSALIDSINSYWAILMIAPAIFFCCMMASFRGYYEGLSNMTPTAITQVVEAIVKLIAGLSMANLIMNAAMQDFSLTQTVFGVYCKTKEAAMIAAIPFGAAGAMLGISISTFGGLVYIFLQYKHKGDGISKEMIAQPQKEESRKILLKMLIRVALPITLGAVVLQLSAVIDTITIQNRLHDCEQLAPSLLNSFYGPYLKDGEKLHEFLYGCFMTCTTLFNLVPAFTGIFGKSALPNVTSAWTEKDRRHLKKNVESIIRVTMLVASPMAFGIAFMAGPILKLFYQNLPGVTNVGAPILSILGVAALFLALVSPLNAILQGVGRMDLPVKYLFFGAAVKLVLNIILVAIPEINILGGAISTLACYLLIASLSILKLRNVITVSLDYSSIFIKPLLAGLSCGVMAYLCQNALTKLMENSIITILSICVGGLFYLITLALLKGISAEDIGMLPNGKKFAKKLEKLRLIR